MAISKIMAIADFSIGMEGQPQNTNSPLERPSLQQENIHRQPARDFNSRNRSEEHGVHISQRDERGTIPHCNNSENRCILERGRHEAGEGQEITRFIP